MLFYHWQFLQDNKLLHLPNHFEKDFSLIVHTKMVQYSIETLVNKNWACILGMSAALEQLQLWFLWASAQFQLLWKQV
jgi:hypothetical protein